MGHKPVFQNGKSARMSFGQKHEVRIGRQGKRSLAKPEMSCVKISRHTIRALSLLLLLVYRPDRAGPFFIYRGVLANYVHFKAPPKTNWPTVPALHRQKHPRKLIRMRPISGYRKGTIKGHRPPNCNQEESFSPPEYRFFSNNPQISDHLS